MYNPLKNEVDVITIERIREALKKDLERFQEPHPVLPSKPNELTEQVLYYSSPIFENGFSYYAFKLSILPIACRKE